MAELKKVDHNKSEDRIASQAKINVSKNKKCEGEKIPDFIMNKLPVTDINAIEEEKMKISHIQFTEESMAQQGERKAMKVPKVISSGKQKILKKPKTADSSEDL